MSIRQFTEALLKIWDKYGHPYGWRVAGEFRPAMATFTTNDAVPPFPPHQTLHGVDTNLDLLICEAFPLPKPSC